MASTRFLHVTHPDTVEESRVSEGYSVGHAGMAEDAAKRPRTRAGEEFAQGHDEKARWLRDEAVYFDEQGTYWRQCQAAQKEVTARLLASSENAEQS